MVDPDRVDEAALESLPASDPPSWTLGLERAAAVPRESNPDFAAGVPSSELGEGRVVLGHTAAQPILVSRRGGVLCAVSATCTHYGASLGRGLVVDGTVRCPLHHACFDLVSGRALRAPALDPLTRYEVEESGGCVRVSGKVLPASTPARHAPSAVRAVVIVGGGAAGHAAAEALRGAGFDGSITLVGAERSPPCDRPNLSKDFLAGRASESWLWLRPSEFFERERIELVLDARVSAVALGDRRVLTADGRTFAYDRLLLATGADPVALTAPGAELSHVHSLRTVADARRILDALVTTPRVAVIGASFIGLEVAASLRARGLAVTVLAPDSTPLERVFGREVGDFLRRLHERHGVHFELGHTACAIERDAVVLDDGRRVPAELVIAAVGVRPAVGLAEGAGIATERGILVDQYLETSAPGVFAAGDVASWPDARTGERMRVEHWVVAERLGQIAARNLLGARERCDLVPFFWTRQYDLEIGYVGHAERWDALEIDGELERRDARVTYRRRGKAIAIASVGRPLENLRAELALERGE